MSGMKSFEGKRAVLYIRVSTDEQASNNSLPQQERQLKQWCEQNGVHAIKLFREDHSAKTFERPEWIRLLEFIRAKGSNIDLVLVTRADRFSRNLLGSLNVLDELKRLNTRFHAIDQPLDDTLPESPLLQAIMFAIPEVENRRRSDTITKGMHQAMREGKWMHQAPKGYEWKRDGKQKWIEPKEPEAGYIREIFRRFLAAENLEAIRKDLYRKFKCSKSQIHLLIRNPMYAGKVRVPAWRDEREEIVNGLHEALIPYEQFQRVQAKLNGGKKQSKWNHFNPEFPLKAHILCPECGKVISASASKGRNKHYHYYHCTNKGHLRMNRDEIHASFAEYLKRFSFHPEIIQLFEEELRDVFASKGQDNKKRIRQLEGDKAKVEELLSKIEDKFGADEIPKDSFDRAYKRHTLKMQEIEFQIGEERDAMSVLDRDALRGLRVLTALSETFESASPEGKSRLAGSIFPENLVYENGNFRTARMNSVISLLANIDRGSSKSEMKKAGISTGSSRLVHPTGFEPVFSP